MPSASYIEFCVKVSLIIDDRQSMHLHQCQSFAFQVFHVSLLQIIFILTHYSLYIISIYLKASGQYNSTQYIPYSSSCFSPILLISSQNHLISKTVFNSILLWNAYDESCIEMDEDLSLRKGRAPL